LELRADGLRFVLTFGPPDSVGWMRCRAVVDAPGFHGDLEIELTRTDLESFRSQLAISLRESGSASHVRLTSTFPGIEVAFRVEPSGKVEGQYMFGGFGPKLPSLSGYFEADRGQLAPLLSEVDRVLGQRD
jgi:hypothetical protein